MSQAFIKVLRGPPRTADATARDRLALHGECGSAPQIDHLCRVNLGSIQGLLISVGFS